MSHHSDFSSWSREQEASFVVYEERRAASQKQAWTIAVIAGAASFVIALGIFLGVEPDRRDISKDMNMSNLTKKKSTSAPAPKKEEAPAPAPAPTPAPATAPAPAAPAAPATENK